MPRRRIDLPAPPPEPEWLDEGEWLAMEDDPVRTMRRWRESYVGPGGHSRYRMIVGLGGETHGRPFTNFVATTAQEHLLALGPPRSHAGKTASMMIPIVLSQLGPVVTASTKPDVMIATAMARAQHGQVWVYAPDGEPVPPGMRELKWSPTSGAEDWHTALTTADEMVRTLDVSDMRSGGHWKDRAADLLAAVFHWAALTGGTMRDARNAVYQFSNPTGDGDETWGQLIWRSLRGGGRNTAERGHSGREVERRQQFSPPSAAVRAVLRGQYW